LRERFIKHCTQQEVSQGEVVRGLITSHLGVELDRLAKLENRVLKLERACNAHTGIPAP